MRCVSARPAALLCVFLRLLLAASDPPPPPPFLRLPVFVDSRRPLLEKEHFSPARGTGQEPLPERVREVLLPARPPGGGGGGAPRPAAPADAVTTWCEQDRLRVRVERRVLAADARQSDVTLGTCPASSSTADHLHFDYDLSTCGTKRMVIDDQVTFSNALRYDPPRPQGPIRRAAPFAVPVACRFNRYLYSYKVGYTPQMQLRKVFKQMKNGAKFILTPRNAQWERLSPSDQYVLGKPMYFQAEAPAMAADQRLYVHSCYATPQRSHTSTPQFHVVTNFGCMVESKDGRSRFVPHRNDAVRFSVDAFLFKGATGQRLYMHCSMSTGSSAPRPTAKACNYDAGAGRWVELYGPPAVCDCCDSNCSSAASTVTRIISSAAWTVEPGARSGATHRRKTGVATAAGPTAPGEASERRAEVGAPEVEGDAKETQWPFGDGGVTWEEEQEEVEEEVEEEAEEEVEERQVKGSAVVEEEESAEPRRIFEDIFDFD